MFMLVGIFRNVYLTEDGHFSCAFIDYMSKD